MAYDEKLAGRVRAALARRKAVAEIKMFGGLCFTLRGNMCCGVLGADLVAKFDKEEHERMLKEPGVRPFDFAKRPMRGIVYVSAAAVKTPAALKKWVDRCVAHAGTLPPKA